MNIKRDFSSIGSNKILVFLPTPDPRCVLALPVPSVLLASLDSSSLSGWWSLLPCMIFLVLVLVVVALPFQQVFSFSLSSPRIAEFDSIQVFTQPWHWKILIDPAMFSWFLWFNFGGYCFIVLTLRIHNMSFQIFLEDNKELCCHDLLSTSVVTIGFLYGTISIRGDLRSSVCWCFSGCQPSQTVKYYWNSKPLGVSLLEVGTP